MKPKYTKESGFTLIELLVVVAIIGILSATSVMSYDTIKTKVWRAEQAILQNNLRTAFEARSGDVTNLPINSYRLVYNYWSTERWGMSNTTPNELIPGMPLPKPINSSTLSGSRGRYYFYALERNCSAATPTCYRYQIQVGNCHDGMVMRYLERVNGTTLTNTYYDATYDSIC